jgi:hypothetical protein
MSGNAQVGALGEYSSGSGDRADVLRVSSERHAEALCAEILRFDRDYPVVGLTCLAGTRDPALSPELVRERIWPSVPVYVIEPREARTVIRLLPDQHGAYNGAARVWWPGVDHDSEPSWHPLIYDSSGIYGDEALEQLAAEFALKSGESIGFSSREQAALRLRSAPRPAALSSSADDHKLAPVLLTSRKDLRRLTTDLRRGDRDYPIVVLTFADGAEEPGVLPALIRPAIDPRGLIYVLGTRDLCSRLTRSVGSHLAVDEGDARVFWPGVSARSNPDEHPLVSASGDGDWRGSAVRLFEALELSRPGVRGHVRVLRERLQTTEKRAADTLRELRESRAECAKAVARADAAETNLAVTERQLGALQEAGLDMDELEAVAGLDQDALMQRLICREWLTSLQAADRREHLLGGYRFGPKFLESVKDRRIATPTTRIAFACAMVACGRAAALPGLEPHAWREGTMSGSRGDDPQAVRVDGGKGLMCNLGHGRGAARLFYWALPGGNIEFDSVRNHEAIGQRR